jgi:hypothetical protein
MSREDRIRAANRLCSLVEKVGVPILREIFKAIQEETPPKNRRAPPKDTVILGGLIRAGNLLAGYVPWEKNCEGYPTPSWYRVKDLKRPEGSPPLNPLFLDVVAPTTHRMLPKDLIKACDIIETPLHLLLNLAVEEQNIAYKNLVNYLIQISDRLPLEDHHE